MFEKVFDIITFGSATQDLILKPKHVTALHYEKSQTQKEVCFPMGSKVDIEDMLFNSGGGGTNTAATFALQGFKTAFCGTVGQDVSGQEIINELKKLGIDTSLVQKTDKKRTNHSVVILNGSTSLTAGSVPDRTIMAYRGAAEVMEDMPFKKLKTKWLYLAPLSGLLCDSFEALVNFAALNKIKLAVNPGMAQLALPNFSEIAKKIDVLIMNQEEASFLTKIAFEQENEIFKKIVGMLALNRVEGCPGILVMTKGGAGVTVSAASPKAGESPRANLADGGPRPDGRDGKAIYSAVPPITRKIVDTTGAGDAFGSGFVAEYIRSGNIEAAVQLGMANSIGCISQVGAKSGLLKKGEAFEKVEVIKNII